MNNTICNRAWLGMLAVTSLILLPAIALAQDFPVKAIDSELLNPNEIPALTSDEALPEPDYTEVAEAARAIADEIESREITLHMQDAGTELFKPDILLGYPKTEEAYVDMREMIKFCESMSGNASSACKFKLQITMKLNPGNTLGQLKQGMSPGTGLTGTIGQGVSGQSGSQTPFGMFGPHNFGQKSQRSTRIGPRKMKSQRDPSGKPDPLAGNVEELNAAKRSPYEMEAEADAPLMEEYRSLIEQYFNTLAEEDNQP